VVSIASQTTYDRTVSFAHGAINSINDYRMHAIKRLFKPSATFGMHVTRQCQLELMKTIT
jgi:hypothetical protein